MGVEEGEKGEQKEEEMAVDRVHTSKIKYKIQK